MNTSKGSNRIIPALAGNTLLFPQLLEPSRDHPRSRGEYWVPAGQASHGKGSSPLSRGIPLPNPKLRDQQRIIPALAGNTVAATSNAAICQDHPRSRGEYSLPRKATIPRIGSSPLSRGIPAVADVEAGLPGIIPALAGNTPGRRSTLWAAKDHPRSRGEYNAAVRNGFVQLGSSPLSRGIPRWGSGRGGVNRIIPALAGNTEG